MKNFMAKDLIIAGIDVGADKIRTVVAVYDEEKSKPHIIGLGVSVSKGMRKGRVVDVNEVIKNISDSLSEAERMSGVPVYNAFVSVGGNHLEGINSKGVVAINGNEITDYDTERVLEAAQAVSMPPNQKTLRVVPKEYVVDNTPNIKNPVGMMGTRLEAEAHIITGLSQSISNLEKCVHQAGVSINDFVPVPLAVSESVLSKRQKELGVVSIDLGSSSTTITVYEEGVLLHTSVLPIGGESVTNDIAIGQRMSVDTAEKIKKEYGTAIPEEVKDREVIDLSQISKIDLQKVGKKELAEIIKARYQEIFHFINQELKSIGRDGMLPAGAILTGSAVKMPGVLDIARDTLSLPVQIGFPQNISGVVDRIDDPAYAVAVGLIKYGVFYESQGGSFTNFNFSKVFGSFGSWLKNLLP